jgi:hypothetical protein
MKGSDTSASVMVYAIRSFVRGGRFASISATASDIYFGLCSRCQNKRDDVAVVVWVPAILQAELTFSKP